MKEHFYYIRDDRRRPVITVCILSENGVAKAKGMAVCSLQDNPSKKVGREIAKNRAYHAFTKKVHAEFCREKAIYVIEDGNWPGGTGCNATKYTDRPFLYVFEKGILKRKSDLPT